MARQGDDDDQGRKKIGPSVDEVLRDAAHDIRQTWEQVTFDRDLPRDAGEPDDLTGHGADLFREFFGVDREGEDMERERAQAPDRDIER